MVNSSPAFYKNISLFLIICLLTSPISIFILSNNIITALIFFLINCLIFFYSYYKIKQRFVFYSLFYINIILFFFINAEIVFRNNFKKFNINNLYENRGEYYFNKSNLTIVLEDKEYQTIYKTNDFGYRVGHFTHFPKKVDWLFIGDSYTQGAQVNFEDLYTTKLNEKYSSIGIVNSGVSGFGLSEEYHYFIHEGINFKPKKVFITLCVLNDFNTIEPREYNFFDMLMDKSTLARFILYDFRFKKPSDLVLGRWCDPFFEEEQDNINYNILYTRVSNIKLNNLIKFESYLRLLKEETEKINIKLYIILIPTKEQVNHKYYKEVIEAYNIDTSFVDIYRSSKIVNKIAKELNICFIDPLIGFKKDTTALYFRKDEHLNIYGHIKLSEIIDSVLCTESY